MNLRDMIHQAERASNPVRSKKAIQVAIPKAVEMPPAQAQVQGKNYYYITRNDPKRLEELLSKLEAVDRFAFDFETTSADPLSLTEPQKIVGISFSWAKSTACYLPIGHTNYGANWNVDVLQCFKHLFEGDKLKIAHNAKFETHWLKKVGINLSLPIFDPLLGVNLLKEKYPELGLKPLVEQVFNYSMITYDEITGTVKEWTGEHYKSGKRKGEKKYTTRQRTFDEVPVDERCLEYTCADSDWALQLTDIVTSDLKEAGVYELCTTLDIPLMLCLVDLELNGFHTDPERFQELKRLAEQKIEEIESSIMEEIRRQLRLPEDATEIIVPVGKKHKPFNLNSTAHLSWLLYDQLQLPIIQRTDTGKPSTSAEVLEKLDKKVEIPLFKHIMEYKTYQKLMSTYLEGNREGTGYIPHIRKNNRIHSTIDQVFVSTGRFSSSAPNLQNVPRAGGDVLGIRGCFLAPSAEHALAGEDSLYLFCDYSQIELRVFAWYAQEPAMLDAFFKGQDLHGRTAWEMYRLGDTPFELEGVMHEPIEVHEVAEKAPTYRQYAKAINFGIIYGLTASGLANDLWKDTSDEALRRGQGLLNRYLQTYTQVEAQQKRFIAEARRNGYAQTMFGRKRILPDITAHNKFKRMLAERQAMNAPVQGSASEIIKLAMVRIHQQAPPWLRMIMQIHDELVFEVPASKILEGAEFVKRLMELPIPGFDVPIVAEPEIALRWGSGFELDLNDCSVKIENPEDHEEFIRRAELGGVKCLTNIQGSD